MQLFIGVSCVIQFLTFDINFLIYKRTFWKVLFDEIDSKYINALGNPTYENLMKIAIDSSDAIIKGSENISSEINDYLKNYKKPILDYQPTDSFAEPYMEFYDKILS